MRSSLGGTKLSFDGRRGERSQATSKWAEKGEAVGTPGRRPTSGSCQGWRDPCQCSKKPVSQHITFWHLRALNAVHSFTLCLKCLWFEINSFGWLSMRWIADAKSILHFSEGLLFGIMWIKYCGYWLISFPFRAVVRTACRQARVSSSDCQNGQKCHLKTSIFYLGNMAIRKVGKILLSFPGISWRCCVCLPFYLASPSALHLF